MSKKNIHLKRLLLILRKANILTKDQLTTINNNLTIIEKTEQEVEDEYQAEIE